MGGTALHCTAPPSSGHSAWAHWPVRVSCGAGFPRAAAFLLRSLAPSFANPALDAGPVGRLGCSELVPPYVGPPAPLVATRLVSDGPRISLPPRHRAALLYSRPATQVGRSEAADDW
ncbi:uncharacterized protein PSFLO_01676 [Pseudozyma flocculosa]|uniref:Uncharacterized protein n=1 Tax=Pseudozyma flocculosa TaxID=84751 RepID=A0A5C3EWQ5_9BASI|nr:uncharacterized protein PSFLO_01676 [Pseudozyma flocculosa]